MTGSDDRPASSLRLPTLKSRQRGEDPFHRNMAAIVEGAGEETRDLAAQAQEQTLPPAASPPSRSKSKPVVTNDDTARVHTRVPTSLMIELQVYCARNRTSMQDVVQRLITDFLARQSK